MDWKWLTVLLFLFPCAAWADVHLLPVEVLLQDGSREFGYFVCEQEQISGVEVTSQQPLTLLFTDKPEGLTREAEAVIGFDFDYMDYKDGVLEVSWQDKLYRLASPRNDFSGEGLAFYPGVDIDPEGYFEMEDNPPDFIRFDEIQWIEPAGEPYAFPVYDDY